MINHGERTSREMKTSWRASSLGLLFLTVIGICYYGIYWRSGLLLGGEDGLAAVIAQRLNAGERPIVDTFLGYNVGWFYPIAWLFKVFGPSYLLLRCWFFLLGLSAGLAAFAIVLGVTRRSSLAFLTGLAVILMPGAIGRNYMGLLGALGMLGILRVFIIPPDQSFSRVLWMLGAGISISLAWIIRIDLGFFQTILFFLTLFFFLLKPETGFPKRLLHSAIASLVLMTVFLSIQLPVYRNAMLQGYGPQYAQQYLIWPTMIRDGVRQVLSSFIKSGKHGLTTAPDTSTTSITRKSESSAIAFDGEATGASEHETSASYNTASLKRPPIGDIFHAQRFNDRIFALLIYLPLPSSILFILWGLVLTFRSWLQRSVSMWLNGGVLLVSTGSALVLFPQYFFWRPDMIHLAEFMVPFMVALVLGVSLALHEFRRTGPLTRFGLFVIIAMASLDLGIYLVKGWQTAGAGSIASCRRRHLEFKALNGVRVKLNAEELSRATLLRDSVLSHSKQGEYVVCYPYLPMVNFMTDRPSYEYNLYADNALPAEQFFDQAKSNIQIHHPSVIVIDTGRINDTEASRFSNWASKTYAFIKDHYSLVASDKEVEIYALNPGSPQQLSPSH